MALYAVPKTYYAQYVHGQSLDDVEKVLQRSYAFQSVTESQNSDGSWKIHVAQNNFQNFDVADHEYVTYTNNGLNHVSPDQFNQNYSVGTYFNDANGPFDPDGHQGTLFVDQT